MGAEDLRYNKLNTELKNIYIMGLDGYPQYLPVVTNILNNYIMESGGETYTSGKLPEKNRWEYNLHKNKRKKIVKIGKIAWESPKISTAGNKTTWPRHVLTLNRINANN